MRKLMMTAALAAATVAGAGGCASLGRASFAEPVVNFRNLTVSSLGLSGGSLEVELSVYNPNRFKLDATQLTYNLLIDSIPFGSGTLDDRFTVQENDSTVVRLPIAFTYRGVGEAGRQLIQTGTVNYRVNGDVTVATPLGNFTRPYDRKGRYALGRGAR